jgi:hypothetical protein
VSFTVFTFGTDAVPAWLLNKRMVEKTLQLKAPVKVIVAALVSLTWVVVETANPTPAS